MADAGVATATAVCGDASPKVMAPSLSASASLVVNAPTTRVVALAGASLGSCASLAPRPSLRSPAASSSAVVSMRPWTSTAVSPRGSVASSSGVAQSPGRSVSSRPAAAMGAGVMQQQRTSVLPPRAQLASGSGLAFPATPSVSPRPSPLVGSAIVQAVTTLVVAHPAVAIGAGVASRGLADAVDLLSPERSDEQTQIELSDVSAPPVRVASSGASGSSVVSGSSVPRVVVS